MIVFHLNDPLRNTRLAMSCPPQLMDLKGVPKAHFFGQCTFIRVSSSQREIRRILNAHQLKVTWPGLYWSIVENDIELYPWHMCRGASTSKQLQ